MLTLSMAAPCLQLYNIVANKNVTWKGRKDDSNGCGFLEKWHSYLLSPPKKNVDSEKSGLSRVVRRTCIKEALCLCPPAY